MMKKFNVLSFVIGLVCFFIAGYILFDKFFTDNELDINFNEEEELVLLNNKLSEIGSPLGWIVIVNGIDNMDSGGNYNLDFDKNLFDRYNYRQLFVMEYILSNPSNNELFTVLDNEGNVIDDIPTSDFSLSYFNYNQFNSYYKSLFGDDFDITRAKKGNTSYDNNYVYYENRRAGSNGVYVSMIQSDSIEYKKGEYISNVIVTYSTKASELFGIEGDNATLKYTKDINDNIILKSFVLENR